jgi:hypothetical protein
VEWDEKTKGDVLPTSLESRWTRHKVKMHAHAQLFWLISLQLPLNKSHIGYNVHFVATVRGLLEIKCDCECTGIVVIGAVAVEWGSSEQLMARPNDRQPRLQAFMIGGVAGCIRMHR